MKTTVYDYNLHVNGIFGRKRKAQRELFTIVKHSAEKLSADEVKVLMDKKLAEIKLKGKYSLQERVGTIENDGGFEIYSTNLFLGDSSYLFSGVMVWQQLMTLMN